MWVINRNTGELRHHGTKGMKWGQRLYQNKDGSLTALGKLRYGTKTEYQSALKKQAAKKAAKAKVRQENKAARNEVKKWEKIRKKPIHKLSSEELEFRAKRLMKERDMLDVQDNVDRRTTSAGKRFAAKFVENAANAAGEAVVNVGKTVVSNFLKNRLGLDLDPLESLANEARKVGYEKQIAEGYAAINKARKPDAAVDHELENLEREDKMSKYRRNIVENNNAINNANRPVNERKAEAEDWGYRKTIADAKRAEMQLEDDEEKRRKRQQTNG